MKLLITMCLVFFIITIKAQQKINLKYDATNKIITADKTSIKHGNSYVIILDQKNTATIKPKVILKYFDISSTTPEILKPILNLESSDEVELKNLNSQFYFKSLKDIKSFNSFNEKNILDKKIKSYLKAVNITEDNLNITKKKNYKKKHKKKFLKKCMKK